MSPQLLRPILIAALAVFGLAFVPPAASAQATDPHAGHNHGSEELTQEELMQIREEQAIVPESEGFKQATEALREHLKEMRALFVRFHVAMSDEAFKHRNAFLDMVEESYQLHQTMMAQALIEFKAGGKNREKIAGMFIRLLDREIEMDRHEGLLPIALALHEAGVQHEKLEIWIVQLAVSANQYEVVEQFIDRVIEKAPENRFFQSLRKDLPMLKQRWATELKMRESDAAGEPLPLVRIATSKGFVEIELFENQAPETVGNFIHLVERGFYDGLDFHTVIEHLAAQGGCPDRDGKGNAGYTIYSEASKPNARKFFRGSVAMAIAGDDPQTASSQFFIPFLPTYDQDGIFTVFGRVTKGMHVVASFERVNASKEKKEGEPAAMPDEIRSISVIRKRDHAYEPNIATRLRPDAVAGADAENAAQN